MNEPLRSRVFTDQTPFVAGWGSMTRYDDRSPILMQLQVPVIDNEICRELQKNAGSTHVELKISDHVICAGGVADKGFWIADSGGPLMLPIHQNGSFPFYQIGIVSYTNDAGRENVPGIYTKVQYYADWIKEHVQK